MTVTTTAIKWAAIAIVAGSAGFTLTACSTPVTPSPPDTVAANEILTMSLPSDVTATGVVTAAVILRAGSVEEAVSNGTITPAEVDLARQAMAEGTLDLWAQRAEQDVAK